MYKLALEEMKMTIDEVYAYYKSGRQLRVKAGMSHNNFTRWRARGYIPIETQLKIEHLTNGDLKANLSHCKKEDVDAKPSRD